MCRSLLLVGFWTFFSCEREQENRSVASKRLCTGGGVGFFVFIRIDSFHQYGSMVWEEDILRKRMDSQRSKMLDKARQVGTRT